MNIGLESLHGSIQGDCPDQEGDHNDVGEEGREPNDISGLMQAPADDQVDNDPAHEEGAGQFPLKCAEAVFEAVIALEDTISEIIVEFS